MLNIFICEDSIKQRSQIVEIVKNYIMINNYDAKIAAVTEDPDEILSYLEQNPSAEGLYFLDIDLGDNKLNGIQLGAEIRKRDSFAHIVFITMHGEMLYTTFLYSVEAMDYIIKDTGENIATRVKRAIDTAYERHQMSREEKRVYTIEVGDTIRVFDIDDIIFFESSPTVHKVIMHHTEGEIEFYEKMKNLEEIDDNFTCCHQSYVINLNHVKEVMKKERIAVMSNGAKCLVSHRGWKTLIERLKIM